MLKKPSVFVTFVWVLLLCCTTTLVEPVGDQLEPEQAEPVKRAVLIGVDDYLANPRISDLSGCGNDVDLMRNVLIGKFDFEPQNILVLKDSQATRQGILDGIRGHLGQSKHGDIALVHFSGHGSEMKDVNGDELDGMDETIVPHDSRQNGIFDISDDQINDLMSEISAKTPNAVFILDSCHSGTAARAAMETGAGSVARYAPPDNREPPASETASRGLEGADDFRLPGANYVLISGCRANEVSNESRFGGVRHGAMTFFLERALRAAGDKTTYRDIMDQTKADVSARFKKQHPQLEGTGADTVIFGAEMILPRPYVLVEPWGDGTATVAAGVIYGLQVGTKLDVYPPGTKVFDQSSAIGSIRVSSVDTFSSSASIESGSIAPHSRTVLEEIRLPGFRAGVFFADSSTLLREVATELADHDSVEVTTDRDEAEIRVSTVHTSGGGKVILQGRDLDNLSEVALSESDAKGKIVDRVAHWARWFAVLAINNPSPDLSIDLRVELVDGDTVDVAPESLAPGSRVRVSVRNNSQQNVHPVLLDLTDKGKIDVIYPLADLPDVLPPGETRSRDFFAKVPEGETQVVDFVKAIVTTQTISPSVFELPPIARSASPEPVTSKAPKEARLEDFLRRSSQGLTRDLTPVQVTGWATKQAVLRVNRPEADTDGFAVHFDDEAAASRAVAGLSALATRGQGDGTLGVGYEVVEVPGDPTMVELQRVATRSGADMEIAIGNAFDEAYRIRDRTGARRVEPLLEQELPQALSAPDANDPGTRGLGSDDPLPRAINDVTWSHKYSLVPEAWATLQAMGKPAGAVARGVVIAHPDTGYLQHPEIWDPPSDRPILFDKGWDYFAEDAEPIDEKLDERPLDNPVHGTGSASAIISRSGCQLAGVSKCPTGVAQGAHLVPLRINRSVVNLSTKKLTQAILDISGSDRSRVKVDTDLASIAMGGAPSWALWKAVKKAEERGYIIVAAAGNYVRTVVWPARFDSVIAVAATNADCKPWKHSSRGATVDMAAPGESVWRATLDAEQDDKLITGMGTGTTYGTATTSGVVALWIAKHKGSPAYEALKRDGELVSTLRRLLQETSWRPGSDRQPAEAECVEGYEWDSGSFGAGIVDAKALLDAPLLGGTSRAERAATVDQLPLWRSLYGEDESFAQSEGDYRELFGLEDGAELEAIAIYEAEIMYHYAADEKVAEAIENVALNGDRSKEAYALIRERLRGRDLSSRLRETLQ